MSSPLPFLPLKTFYFTVNVGEPRRLETIECFVGDDISLVISFIDSAGNAVDVSGSTAKLQFTKSHGSYGSIYSDSAPDLTSNKVTVVFNTDSSLNSGGGEFSYQIRMTRGGYSSVVAWGLLENNALIE